MSNSLGDDSQNQHLEHDQGGESEGEASSFAPLFDYSRVVGTSRRRRGPVVSETKSDGRNTIVISSPSGSVDVRGKRVLFDVETESHTQARSSQAEGQSQGVMVVNPWANIMSSFTLRKEQNLRRMYGVAKAYRILIPSPEDRAFEAPAGYATFHVALFRAGLRFPIPPLFLDISDRFGIPINQFAPNAIRMMAGFALLCRYHEIEPCPDFFCALFLSRSSQVDGGIYYFTPRGPAAFFTDYPYDKAWKDNFFYASPPPGAERGFTSGYLSRLGPPIRPPPLSEANKAIVESWNRGPRNIAKLVDSRLLFAYGYSPVGPALQDTTIGST